MLIMKLTENTTLLGRDWGDNKLVRATKSSDFATILTRIAFQLDSISLTIENFFCFFKKAVPQNMMNLRCCKRQPLIPEDWSRQRAMSVLDSCEAGAQYLCQSILMASSILGCFKSTKDCSLEHDQE